MCVWKSVAANFIKQVVALHELLSENFSRIAVLSNKIYFFAVLYFLIPQSVKYCTYTLIIFIQILCFFKNTWCVTIYF